MPATPLERPENNDGAHSAIAPKNLGPMATIRGLRVAFVREVIATRSAATTAKV